MGWGGRLLGLSAAAVLLLWPAAGGGEDPIATWYGRGRDPGLTDNILRVAVDASYPPLARVDPSGRLVGLEVNLAEEIAARLGARLRLENADFGSGLDALVVGRYDLVLAGLPVYPELTQDVSFSIPYYDDGLVLVTRAGEVDRVRPDLLDGKTIGAEVGSPGEQWLRKSTRRGGPHPYPVSFWELPDLVRALGTGQLWGAVLDHTTARQVVAQDPRLQIVYPFLESRPMVIAVRRPNRGLLFAVDLTLRAMSSDGTLKQLQERWTSEQHIGD